MGNHDMEFIEYKEIFKILQCKRCFKRWAQLGDSEYLRLPLKEAQMLAREQGKAWIFE